MITSDIPEMWLPLASPGVVLHGGVHHLVGQHANQFPITQSIEERGIVEQRNPVGSHGLDSRALHEPQPEQQCTKERMIQQQRSPGSCEPDCAGGIRPNHCAAPI